MGVQERRLPAPQGVGREGRSAAPPGAGCRDDRAYKGAGRLHRCEGGRALQGRKLPLLGAAGVLSADPMVACPPLAAHPLSRSESWRGHSSKEAEAMCSGVGTLALSAPLKLRPGVVAWPLHGRLKWMVQKAHAVLRN